MPERLWSVPMPDCFSKVQVLGVLFESRRPRVWDLSVEAERIDYYEWVIVRGLAELMLDSVDGLLLMQVWERLNLPEVVREAWQPVIDAATASQDMAAAGPGRVQRLARQARSASSGGQSAGASGVTDSQADLTG